MDSDATETTPSGSKLATWLFNPFHHIAGGQALGAGIVLIMAAALVGSISGTHFDGVLDVQLKAAVPLWWFVLQPLVAWVIMGALLLMSGWALSGSHIRTVDVFGTQALARAPTILAALFALLPGSRRSATALTTRFTTGVTAGGAGMADYLAFGVFLLVTVLAIVWMVYLMFRAFAVSCNVSGGKAIGVFIAAIIIGEVLSKVAIGGIGEAAGPVPQTTLTIPWQSGDRTTYTWVSRLGDEIGGTVYTVRAVDHDGLRAYEIGSQTQIGPMRDTTHVVVSADDLSPFAVRRVTHQARGRFDIRGTYEEGKLKITATTRSGSKDLEVGIPRGTYDNEEILFYVRALPLRVGYSTSFQFAVVATGAKGSCTLEVLGEEMVTVPAGILAAYKVKFDLGAMAPKMYAWYGKGTPHYLVKYDNGRIRCELKDTR